MPLKMCLLINEIESWRLVFKKFNPNPSKKFKTFGKEHT